MIHFEVLNELRLVFFCFCWWENVSYSSLVLSSIHFSAASAASSSWVKCESILFWSAFFIPGKTNDFWLWHNCYAVFVNSHHIIGRMYHCFAIILSRFPARWMSTIHFECRCRTYLWECRRCRLFTSILDFFSVIVEGWNCFCHAMVIFQWNCVFSVHVIRAWHRLHHLWIEWMDHFMSHLILINVNLSDEEWERNLFEYMPHKHE